MSAVSVATGMRTLATLLSACLLALVPASALATGGAPGRAHTPGKQHSSYDRRSEQAPVAPAAALGSGQERLRRRLGRQGVVRREPGTGTPRLVIRRDGFLTGPRRGRARDLALDYVRANRAVFGLDASDADGLRLVREQKLAFGIRRVQFVQTAGGIASLDTGLRATVDARGRLVSVSGGPRPGFAKDARGGARLSATQALRRAMSDAGSGGPVEQQGASRGAARRTDFEGANSAQLTWFVEAERVRLAWRVLFFADSQHTFDTVLDARDGTLLRRRNLTHSATGLAWDNYPTAALGSTQVSRNLDPWLEASPNKLRGPNAWVYADINDNINDPAAVPDSGAPGDAVQIRPVSGNWNFAPGPFAASAGRTCPATNACSWDSGVASSWNTNRQQNGTQVFFFLNNFHDHLENAPGIEFDNAAGNFEGNDLIHAQTDDGANGPGALPNDAHVNNADMTTLPDGSPPRMQMYLWGSPANDVNGGDDAGIVYHEYTHGLNSRLYCCDGAGFDLLVGAQPGALHEAWADWYAFDYLNASNLLPDTPSSGEVGFSPYEGLDVRFQAADCPSGGGQPACPGSVPGNDCGNPIPGRPGAGSGGFTYGDFGRICEIDDDSDGVPDGEVHADGEIWASTLWDLRAALIAAHGSGDGVTRARALTTASMLIGPANPTFLEVRDAILAANAALGFGPDDCTRIWTAFAARGMGSNASSSGADDTRQDEGFANPAPAACASSPAPGPPTGPGGNPAPPPARPAAPNLRDAKSRIRVSPRGLYSYSFRAGAGLSGSSLLKTRKRVVVSRRGHVTVGRKSFRVPGNGRVTLRLKLSRKNLRLLRRNRSFPLRVTVTVRNAAGSAAARKNLTLLAPKGR